MNSYTRALHFMWTAKSGWVRCSADVYSHIIRNSWRLCDPRCKFVLARVECATDSNAAHRQKS
jgi:hypothetical protein